jgi:hypothetical protein
MRMRTEPCYMPVAAKPLSIMAYDPWRVMGCMSAPEPSGVERQDLKPCDMWRHRSPPPRYGKVQSYETRGSARAHLSREVRSGAMGHAVVPEPT